MDMREQALYALGINHIDDKVQAVEALFKTVDCPIHTEQVLQAQIPLPGRPEQPVLVPPQQVKMRSAHTLEGRIALLHSIAHIEFNAINLALDIIWRFTGMPAEFYREWLRVAQEETYHFGLIRDHLRQLGAEYGDLTAHNGLWDMAEKTRDDILARLALVPRTLEARGLDVTPGIQDRLRQAGDHQAVAILDIILRDEIGHVEIGNRWYKYMCAQQQLDPVQCYADLLVKYGVSAPKGPFNLSARSQAGFSQAEIDWLTSL